MSVGPRDNIDRLLVGQYATEKTVCMDAPATAVAPDIMLGAMQDFAVMSRTVLGLRERLKNVCAGVTAKSAAYRSSCC